MREIGATPNALLGLLSLEPMSGYDIRQMISRSIGYFWSESYGQIYPGLKRLAAEGLVVKKTERGKGTPDRHVYSLTAAGREQLRNWLKLPAAREVPRDELLLKLFFGAHAPVEVSRGHVQAYLELQEDHVLTYAALRKKLRKEAANDPQLPFWLITLNRGRHDSEAAVRWCRETLKELDRLESRSKDHGKKGNGEK
jgi:PadR family transcriptional regulator, regulatory protein AphA